eukprot:s6390_g2.t1
MQPRGSIRKDCYARVQQAPTCVPLRLEVAASGSLACSRPCFQGTSSGLRLSLLRPAKAERLRGGFAGPASVTPRQFLARVGSNV